MSRVLSCLLTCFLGLVVFFPLSGARAVPLYGELAQNYTRIVPPVPAPQVPFLDGQEQSVRLGDFKGQVILLNFWATWCAPCIQEMPSLGRVQERRDNLRVVAVSLDRGGLEVPRAFLKKLSLTHLGLYKDQKNQLSRAFKLRAIPSSFLIDKSGNLVGELAGPFEWDQDSVLNLVDYYSRAE